MRSNIHSLQIPNAPIASNFSGQRLGQLQAELVSAARLWATEEVRAAIAHRLSDPITALLFCLETIRSAHARNIPLPECQGRPDVIAMAIDQANRIWGIMEPLGSPLETHCAKEGTLASGRNAIESWARSNGAPGSRRSPSDVRENVLTPREREVLDIIVSGASNKHGAHRLGVTKRTFEVHRANIMEKYEARNAADLVRKVLSGSWEA